MIIRNRPSDGCFQTKQNVSGNVFSQNRGPDLIKVPTFLHEGRHFCRKRSLSFCLYVPMYARIHAYETWNICLWSREYMQMQLDLPCGRVCKGGLAILKCQPNCLIGNKMSGKIEGVILIYQNTCAGRSTEKPFHPFIKNQSGKLLVGKKRTTVLIELRYFYKPTVYCN